MDRAYRLATVTTKFKRTLLAGVLAFAAAVPAGYFGYRHFTHIELDLSPLLPHAETENYQALFERVRATEAGPEGFTFVALGDTRSFFQRARNVLIRAVEEEPSFILSNGDIVRRGTVKEYLDHHLKLVEVVAPIPFIPAPGNHEEGPNDDFAAFKALYGDVRFSFDYANCRFVGINNGDFNKMSGADIDYLEAELSKPGAEHKFVTFHLPPEFLENAVESEGTRGFSWNAGRFHDLMVAQKVNHVFAGHVHGFASEVIDGVRYTITGGGGANLTQALGQEGRVHNFIVVHVSESGVRSEVLKLVLGEWIREELK